MTAEEHPIDETVKKKLKGMMFPKEPAYGQWSLPNQLITKTLKTHLEDSATLEEFIRKLGKAADHERDGLLRTVQLLVKQKAEMCVSELKRNR